MRLEPAGIDGAWFIELEPQRDERGEFARTWCRDVFREAGIDFEPVQCNISRNPIKGTLRGLHFQRPPHGEAKMVQCVRGRIHDVAVDLRRSSPTFGAAIATELSCEGDRLFFIPNGCAHGFLTLESGSDVFYYMGARYVAGSAAGLRWDDSSIDLAWPAEPTLISDRDASFGPFNWTRDALP
jgi:dTDP-4-dehydrorhamnose 3,5-epimerase